jgi:hypothetical protein
MSFKFSTLLSNVASMGITTYTKAFLFFKCRQGSSKPKLWDPLTEAELWRWCCCASSNSSCQKEQDICWSHFIAKTDPCIQVLSSFIKFLSTFHLRLQFFFFFLRMLPQSSISSKMTVIFLFYHSSSIIIPQYKGTSCYNHMVTLKYCSCWRGKKNVLFLLLILPISEQLVPVPSKSGQW